MFVLADDESVCKFAVGREGSGKKWLYSRKTDKDWKVEKLVFVPFLYRAQPADTWSNSIRTWARPDSKKPSSSAAARDTSIIRPGMNGPLSLIVTSTELPFVKLMTLALLPSGNVLCAA